MSGVDEQRAQEIDQVLELSESLGAFAAFSVDLEKDLVRVTPALRAFWGLAEHVKELSLDDAYTHVHPDDRHAVAEKRAKAMRTRQPYHFEFRVLLPHGKVNRLRSVGYFVYDADGRAVRNVSVQRPIANLPGLDSLTGLLDRAAFIKKVRTCASAADDGESFSVIAFDLDHFTEINATYGMPIGDTVLRMIADRLRGIALDGEYFARSGGDHFLGLLRCGADDAVARIASILAKPVVIDTLEIEVTATFGVSLFPRDARDESLVAQANLAMTSLRNTTVSSVRRYDPEMHASSVKQHQLGSALRRAIALDQFELAYQPIVDRRTLRVRSGEALIRWKHPELGTVQPDAFIPIAEAMGLMRTIDAWVMRRACVDFAETIWHPGCLQSISINASAQFLLSPEFKDTVEEALRTTHMPPRRLALEITERSLMGDTAHAFDTLTWLRERGVRVVLDDFGTGYNSLSYLKLYPIDALKIDRFFVSDIESVLYSRCVCSGILAFAAELGLPVIAEGVESEAQAQFLRSRGCSLLQGFLYGKPMPKDEFMQHMRGAKIELVS